MDKIYFKDPPQALPFEGYGVFSQTQEAIALIGESF